MTNQFLTKAEKTIDDLFNKLNKINNDLDMDLIDNNLTIEFEENKTFIISIHEPTEQIWLSSPISGAHHFSLINDNGGDSWKSTRDKKIDLFVIIQKEIIDHCI